MGLKHASVLLLLSASIGAAPLAMAQDRHDDHGDDHGRGQEHGQDHAAPRDDHRPPPRPSSHRAPPSRVADRGHDDGPGAGPDHGFHRGGRLPDEYRNRQYVVDNWREHRLTAPPRGYQWVQTGADYVLVAVATGLIADVLLNH